MTNYKPTGSLVSGDGYGAAILKGDDATYAVRLSLAGRPMTVSPIASFRAASDLVDDFCAIARRESR